MGLTVDYVIADYKTPELAARAAVTVQDAARPVVGSIVLVDAAAGGFSYSDAIHHGVALGDAPIVCALNADVECLDDQRPVVELFERFPEIAVVGPRQVDSFGFVRHAGIVGTNIAPGHRFWGDLLDHVDEQCREEALDCVTVSGSVYYCRRSVWEELGGFLRTPHYYEETWLSYLARHRGWRVVYTGLSTWLHHWGSAPVEKDWLPVVFEESRAIFRAACHREGIECD